MKTNRAFSLVLLFAITFHYSCSPVMYSTVGQNVPAFKEKGEVALSAGFAASEGDGFTVAKGVSLQGAYAIDSSSAVISSLYSMHNANFDDDWKSKGTYFELGIGKFGANKSKHVVGELFLGLGYGSIQNNKTSANVETKFLKPFIQPSGGFTTKYFDILFTPRIGMVAFISHSTNTLDPSQKQEANQFFSEKKNNFVIEPGVTVRLGYKNVKLQYQYNYSSFKEDQTNLDAVNNKYSSLGLYLLIPKQQSK